MRHLLINFISPDGHIGTANDFARISHNVLLIAGFKEKIDALKSENKGLFLLPMVAGRWIVVYRGNAESNENDIMIFIDFRANFEIPAIKEVFDANFHNNLKIMQAEYRKVFSSQSDTVELSYSDPYERVLKQSIFTCDDTHIVLAKAKELGDLFMSSPIEKNMAKVSLAHEELNVGNVQIINVYALIHFGETNGEKEGYIYLKLHDLLSNFNQANDFLSAIERIDTKFDRAFFMERYMPARWN